MANVVYITLHLRQMYIGKDNNPTFKSLITRMSIQRSYYFNDKLKHKCLRQSGYWKVIMTQATKLLNKQRTNNLSNLMSMLFTQPS